MIQHLLKCIGLFVMVAVAAVSAQNLLSNPNAETGTTAGWTDPNNQWGAAAEVTPHGGSYFFWPSRGQVDYTNMYQDVTVPSGSASRYFHLSGWLCNWDQYPHDRATLAIMALGNDDAELAYFQTEQRNPAWIKHVIDAAVPAGTIKLRVLLIATRFVGNDNDAYFDDLSLIVDTIKTPTVTITAAGNAKMVAVGSTLKLTATTVGAVDSAYDWSSSFPSAATVDTAGSVSGVSSGHVYIQATGRQSGAVGIYELSATQVNDIVFTSPVNGSAFQAGKTGAIAWQVVGTVATGELLISRDGGVNFTSIASSITCSNGAYSWSIPNDSVDQRQCVLKMTWSGGSAMSGTFSILSTQSTAVLPNRQPQKTARGIARAPINIRSTGQYTLNGRLIKSDRRAFGIQCREGSRALNAGMNGDY